MRAEILFSELHLLFVRFQDRSAKLHDTTAHIHEIVKRESSHWGRTSTSNRAGSSSNPRRSMHSAYRSVRKRHANTTPGPFRFHLYELFTHSLHRLYSDQRKLRLLITSRRSCSRIVRGREGQRGETKRLAGARHGAHRGGAHAAIVNRDLSAETSDTSWSKPVS